MPPISKPQIRTQIDEIDGRDGDLVTELGYSAYDKTFEIGLYGDYAINEVISYFNSSGTVTFSNESDKFYNYKIIGGIDFEKLIRYRTATVTMHVQPFKYSLIERVRSFEINPQLLKFNDLSETVGGITTTVTGGTVLLSGTASSTAEIYIPIPPITLESGAYSLTAMSSGQNADSCSLRLIYNTPTVANSFGGAQITLESGVKKRMDATITAEKTYNYIYLQILSNVNVELSVDLKLTENAPNEISVYNRGNIYAKPKITIYGSGDISLSLNGKQIFLIELGNEKNITIDVQEMQAYRGDTLRNRIVSGNYDEFLLNIGANIISFTGEISNIEIENSSRWI